MISDAHAVIYSTDPESNHACYLADVESFVAAAASRDLASDPARPESWGPVTRVSLPGGGRLGVYPPRHPWPPVSRPD